MIDRIWRKIEDLRLRGPLRRHGLDLKLLRRLQGIERGTDRKMTIYYRKPLRHRLSQLCDLYGSDKGSLSASGHAYAWPAHSYADYYGHLFDHCRQHVRLVFECGLGTNNSDIRSSMGPSGKPGASLRVWRDYFPNALVFGGDIDRRILFKEERIATAYIDQCNPDAIADFWSTIAVTGFDLMIDDGLHMFDAGATLFTHSVQHLAPGGIYIIEDVSLADLDAYRSFFADKDYVVDFVTLYRPGTRLDGNCLVAIRKPA